MSIFSPRFFLPISVALFVFFLIYYFFSKELESTVPIETLAGTDVDNDGVRDDIEEYIQNEYPDSEKIRVALAQLAKATQQKLLFGDNKQKSVDLLEDGLRAKVCLVYVAGVDDAIIISEQLHTQILNTEERKRAWRRANKQISGQVSTLPYYSEWKNQCEFDPDSFDEEKKNNSSTQANSLSGRGNQITTNFKSFQNSELGVSFAYPTFGLQNSVRVDAANKRVTIEYFLESEQPTNFFLFSFSDNPKAKSLEQLFRERADDGKNLLLSSGAYSQEKLSGNIEVIHATEKPIPEEYMNSHGPLPILIFGISPSGENFFTATLSQEHTLNQLGYSAKEQTEVLRQIVESLRFVEEETGNSNFVHKSTPDLFSDAEMYINEEFRYKILIPKSFSINPAPETSYPEYEESGLLDAQIISFGTEDGFGTYGIKVYDNPKKTEPLQWLEQNPNEDYRKDRVAKSASIADSQAVRISSVEAHRVGYFVSIEDKMFIIDWPGYISEGDFETSQFEEFVSNFSLGSF